MKILIAIGVPRQKEAGAVGVVLNHARELAKRGHQVDCWFLEDMLPRPARPKRFEAFIFAWRTARHLMREPHTYDVVNLHAPSGSVYGLWRRMFRLSGAPPYVMTMQGSEERFVRTMRRERRKGRAVNFGWKNRLWHRVYHQTMYDWSIRTADYGAVANREACVMAELKYNREPGRIRYVPNGVGEEFFLERNYTPRSPVRLLYVGTWLDRKGVRYLTESFRLLAEGNHATVLSVVGCGNSEAEVRGSFAAEIRDRLTVVPFAPRNDMPSVFADHDVFIFPSLVEGMPLALLEAMASGMPAVTTMSGGMADIVEDGFNGLLVPPADSVALASAARRLCDSIELRCRLGHEAQNTARRYTWERVTAKLEEVFRLAIERGRSS
jgi:glycosyltransferase involved in cell wall biosynthesis